MRGLADLRRIQRFMGALSDKATLEARLYFTGGATAVFLGWRASTIAMDILVVPDDDRLLRALPAIKEEIELPGWEGRLYAQALAKIERGHSQDVADVQEMVRGGHVELGRLLRLFEEIAPQLYRYPAIDPGAFRRAVKAAAADFNRPRRA